MHDLKEILLYYLCLQITLWLQGLFLFSLIWTVGGTIAGDGRKLFDQFFRNIVSGTVAEHPKPKSIKITKVCLSFINNLYFTWIFFIFLLSLPTPKNHVCYCHHFPSVSCHTLKFLRNCLAR